MDPDYNVSIVFIARDINGHHNVNWHLINIWNVWLEICCGLIGICFSSSANACSLGCWLQLWTLNMEMYAAVAAECLLQRAWHSLHYTVPFLNRQCYSNHVTLKSKHKSFKCKSIFRFLSVKPFHLNHILSLLKAQKV